MIPDPSTRERTALLQQLVESAFRGPGAHALLANLEDVTDADWTRQLAGGERTVAGIVEHTAIAAILWDEHAFGAAQRSYADVRLESPCRRSSDIGPLREWLVAAHEHFIGSVREFNDDGLSEPRLTHYGAATTVERSIVTVIEHALYHAGEINHLRALLQRDDAWWPGLAGSD